ncbi:MAG: GGDEF domain-containing protein [Roseburia sp.]|nr:GGDEF domain-containing protein [Ruminococcus sp.]MCM1243683.1 GGDEF domain-containing protein [Roseburia sp.]
MEKRVTRIYFAVLLIGVLYAIYASFSYRSHINTGIADKEVVIWDDQMEMTQEGDTYYYRRILPAEATNRKVIVYNTVHMYLEVFIDGNRVYALEGEPDSAVKTTGFCWNVISLSEEDAGKEIVFQVTPVYSDSKPQGSFFYGAYREIEHKVLAERLIRLIISAIIALAGIVMLVYGLFVVKKGQDAETIMQFAIFATMLGIWSGIETQIPDWFFPCSMVIVFLSHLMLMTMLIPFVLFLRHMYHNGESRLWSICCYINCAVIAVRVILQITGRYDLRETLLLTHVCLLLFVVVIVGMTIHEIVVNELTIQVKINSICVLVILASTVLELAIYRISNRSTPLGSIGFLIYIVVMGIVNVRRSRQLMEQARESALYRKLAFTDELTGLSNRTAFREDLEKRMEPDRVTGVEKVLPTVVFMFDLNDLKKCNDTYGHDYGDQYIKMAADALKKIFAEDGKCYRIGGDEFCAWTPYTSLEGINEKLSALEQVVRELDSKGFVVPVSISAGYAVYQEGMDGGGLYSTMKRADAMMYEKKQEYKKRRAGA